MTDRRWLLLVSIGLLTFILTSCVAPGPRISSIQGEPGTAREGGTVNYTINYRNTSQENISSDTVVVVRYNEYLSFNQDALPFPDEINEKQRELRWELGTLRPEQSGSVEVEFKLAPRIPLAVYELIIVAEISSPDAEGSRTGRERTLIEGHPTPTPRPTNTPSPPTPAP